MCCRLAAISVNSSPMWSVLKLSVAVSRSVAWAIASAVVAPVDSRRSRRSPPRSPSCSIMLSPAWPSARVMCSPFSASVMVMRRAASLTCSATSWLICEMSWLKIEMHAVDGVADLLGLADQRVALAAEVLQQRADAHFVVVVGVFERRHLVGDQRLKLGGARQRALDAVAHGGDFAADRLTDGDDRFARDRLRLGEPHRDFRHRLRDQPHFLRAHRHVGEHVEEHDRREIDRAEHGEHRRGEAGRAERCLDFGKVEPAEQEAADHPDAGEDAGENVGGLGGPALDRAQDVADRFLVVVGGGAAQRCRCRPDGAGLRRRRRRPCCALERRPGQGVFRSRVRRQRGRRRRGHLVRRLVVIPYLKRILDRRQRRFRRILHLLRGVRHGRSSPRCYAEPRPQPGINRPRHERVSLERSPPDPPCGSRPQTRRTDSPLPPTYPIGLANRRKLTGKDFLIIVNDRACRCNGTGGSRARTRRRRQRFFRPHCGRLGPRSAHFSAYYCRPVALAANLDRWTARAFDRACEFLNCAQRMRRGARPSRYPS